MERGSLWSLGASPAFALALIAFFLPWYTVSCQGSPLATATGYGMMRTGIASPSRASSGPANPRLTAEQAPGGSFDMGLSPSDAPPDRASRSAGHAARPGEARTIWVGLVPACALLGIALAFAGRRARRARWGAAMAATVLVLTALGNFVAVGSQMRTALRAAGAQGTGDSLSSEFARRLAGVIRLELGYGWYLTLLGGAVALVVAIVSGAVGGTPTATSPAPGPSRAAGEPT